MKKEERFVPREEDLIIDKEDLIRQTNIFAPLLNASYVMDKLFTQYRKKEITKAELTKLEDLILEMYKHYDFESDKFMIYQVSCIANFEKKFVNDTIKKII